MKPKTQTEAVLMLLKKKKKVNILTVFKATGSMSLAERIRDLRNKGHKIKATPVTFKTRFGTTGRYNNYSLK
jgi:hypothetical protein